MTAFTVAFLLLGLRFHDGSGAFVGSGPLFPPRDAPFALFAGSGQHAVVWCATAEAPGRLIPPQRPDDIPDDFAVVWKDDAKSHLAPGLPAATVRRGPLAGGLVDSPLPRGPPIPA